MILQSDRDSKFCSAFFTKLMQCFNVRQAMGTAYDHRFNGIVENKNREVECLLRSVLSQYPDRCFTEFLPLVAFVINSSVHSSIQASPYYAMFGCEPSNPALFSVGPQVRGEVPVGVRNFVEFQADVLAFVRESLLEVQRAVALFQNRKQRDVTFEVGAKVLLNSMNLSRGHFARPEQKLQNPFVGPFEVEARCSDYTYRLKLTGRFKRLHPVFHAVMLKPHCEAEASEFPGRRLLMQEDLVVQSTGSVEKDVDVEVEEALVDADGNPLFELGKVKERKALDTRAKRTKWAYKVSWRGYGPEEDSWITKDHLVGDEAFALVKAFDEAEDAKLRP